MLTPLGIGICAINVAKWLGAEIYVTVGSEDKASFLVKEFRIPRNRIFNSRDGSFLKGIMDATNGSGVDLVINSLSGELLSTSWKCVAPDGAMVEIGKRDSEYPFLRSMIKRELRLGLESRCRQLLDYSLHSPSSVSQVQKSITYAILTLYFHSGW